MAKPANFSRRGHSHPIHVKFINKHSIRVQIHLYNTSRRISAEAVLNPNEEMHDVTDPGWRFHFIGPAGNSLFISLHDDNPSTPRINHFQATEALCGETNEERPLLVFLHLSRLPVEPDMSSVDPLGRPLHSLDGNEYSNVAFVNYSDHAVAMYWFNYQGIRVHYGDISPRDVAFMETFVSHPWQFVDRNSNLSMMVNDSVGGERLQARRYEDSEDYFFPRASPDGPVHARFQILIHPRHQSLKTLAMVAVKREIEKERLLLDAEFVPETLIREVTSFAPKLNCLSLDEMTYF